jgi:Calpain family cysteine protease
MGYNRLDIGSTAYQRADLLAKLTGEDAEVRPIPSEQQGEAALLDAFRDQLNAGKPVLVATRGLRVTNERLPKGIYAGHAYEVTKVENEKIYIRNPWGYRHPDPMDAKTFWEYYRWCNSDGTRDGHYTTLK